MQQQGMRGERKARRMSRISLPGKQVFVAPLDAKIAKFLDAAMPGPFGTDAVRLSVSADTGLEKLFEEGAQHAELPRNR